MERRKFKLTHYHETLSCAKKWVHYIGAIKYFMGYYNLGRGAAAALPVSHARFVDGYRASMGIRHVELAMLNSLDAPPG